MKERHTSATSVASSTSAQRGRAQSCHWIENPNLRGAALAAISALAVGCGGTNAGPVSPGNTNNGGSGAPKSYSAPVQITQSGGATISAISPNGQMIGEIASGAPTYWASPTATPIPINIGAFSGVRVYGINNAGQIVGTQSGLGQATPVYWSSASATPVTLSGTGIGNNSVAWGINASGAIIGTANPGTNSSEAVMWSSPTAAPTALPGPVGGGTTSGTAIADTGEMYGGADEQPLAWASAGATPTPINEPSGSLLVSGFALNPETGEIGTTVELASLQTVGAYWSPPSFTYTQVAVPAGFTKTTFLLGIGKNHLGVGYYSNGIAAAAAVWPTLGTAFVDLNTLIPSGTNWTLSTAAFVTDSGVIIGLGTNPNNAQAWYTIQPS